MKLYEKYLHELGLGGKVAIGAAGLGVMIAHGLYKENKKRKEDLNAGGERKAKRLIDKAEYEADERLMDAQHKCDKLKYESDYNDEYNKCLRFMYNKFSLTFYNQELNKAKSLCGSDKECILTIEKEILRSRKNFKFKK